MDTDAAGFDGLDDFAGVDALRGLDPAEVHRIVTARLGRRIAAIMGYAAGGRIAEHQPLTELGMDSLMAVRIRNAVSGDFGVEPPVALLLQGTSLTDLTAHLTGQLGLAEPDGGAPTGVARNRGQQRAAARQRAALRRKAGQQP